MRLIFADVAKVWPAMHSSVITRLGAHVLIHRQANVGLITTTRHRAIVGVRATAAARPSTRVRYVKRPDSKKDLFYYATPPPEALHSITNLELEEAFVEVSDLRAHNTMDWQRNGFQLVQFSNFQDLVWDDEDQVKQIYYPEVEALLKQTTGANRVHVMAHGFRRGKTPKGQLDMTKPAGRQDVAALTHVDFTDTSGPLVMKAYMGDEAEELSKKPWSIIQVWRPIAGHVQDSPLGMVDATTVSAEDLVPTPIHLASGHQHEIHFVAHNPNHKWFWTSHMHTDEAYVFVNYDSRKGGQPRVTPHAAIADSTVPEDVPIRQSVETRALVFWD